MVAESEYPSKTSGLQDKADRAFPKNILKDYPQWILLAFALFQLYTGYYRFPDFIQRSIHVCFALVLCFIFFDFKRKRKIKPGLPLWDLCLVLITILCTGYIVWNYEYVVMQPFGLTPFELVLGFFTIVLVLEAGRRVVGIVFPLLTAFSIIYAVAGEWFPGRFAHRAISLRSVIEILYFGGEGIWGFFTGISAVVIALFIILAPVLLKSGGAKTFHDVSLRFAGKYTGGAAKAASVMSAGFGTISGSCVANVASTGAFTIPMMKRLGYPAVFAGAVEATASTGGQLMPPIMGAGAFLMAELLGVPYLKICIYAAVPGILYFLSIFVGIHFEAKRIGLEPVPAAEIPSIKDFLKISRIIPVVIPISVLAFSLVHGYSPGFSALLTILAALLLYIFSGGSFQTDSILFRFREMLEALKEGASSLISVAVLIVCAQIIVTMVGLTGFGVKFSSLIIAGAGHSLFFALVLAMVVAMILGMGLPTTAAYLLSASVIGGALQKLGIVPVSIHMFLFYFSILSAITPPVCTAVFVAAPMAGAPWLRVGWFSFRLALPAFIIPFAFAFEPSILLEGTFIKAATNIATATIGIFAMGAGAMGYLVKTANGLQRLIMILSSILMIYPSLWVSVIGMILFGFVFLFQKKF